MPNTNERYCLHCEKLGHYTSDCWSTHGLNHPADLELSRLTSIDHAMRALAATAPNAAPGKCRTCNGHGMIGGLLPGDGGYDGQDCPDCVAPNAAALLRQALAALEHHLEQTRPIDRTTTAISALRAHLAAPAQQAGALLPENPHQDYLSRYWDMGFNGEQLGAGTDSALKAWAEGKKARAGAPASSARWRALDDVPSVSGRYIVKHRGQVGGDAYYTANMEDTGWVVGWSQMPASKPTHWLDESGMPPPPNRNDVADAWRAKNLPSASDAAEQAGAPLYDEIEQSVLAEAREIANVHPSKDAKAFAHAVISMLASRAPLPLASSEAVGKYGNVLRPFVALMERELHANSSKGDRPVWLSMTRDRALLEIYYHVSKLSVAMKNDDAPAIAEHSADVANMAMMALDVCGGLATRAQPQADAAEPVAWRPSVGTASMYAQQRRLAVTKDWMIGWNACLDAIDVAIAAQAPRARGETA